MIRRFFLASYLDLSGSFGAFLRLFLVAIDHAIVLLMLSLHRYAIASHVMRRALLQDQLGLAHLWAELHCLSGKVLGQISALVL